jgi:hypothetical protein
VSRLRTWTPFSKKYSAFAVGWVLPGEVFPLSIRSKGVALSTASNWINNCARSFSDVLPISHAVIQFSLVL